MPLPEDKREAILRDIANGMSLSDVCKQEGYPHRSTVYDDLAADAGFADKYARACELRAEVVFDEIFDIADNATNDWMEKRGEDDAGWIANGENIQRSRLRIDARKWALSKMAPKKYGDKLDVAVSKQATEDELDAAIAAKLAAMAGVGQGGASEPSDG